MSGDTFSRAKPTRGIPLSYAFFYVTMCNCLLYAVHSCVLCFAAGRRFFFCPPSPERNQHSLVLFRTSPSLPFSPPLFPSSPHTCPPGRCGHWQCFDASTDSREQRGALHTLCRGPRKFGKRLGAARAAAQRAMDRKGGVAGRGERKEEVRGREGLCIWVVHWMASRDLLHGGPPTDNRQPPCFCCPPLHCALRHEPCLFLPVSCFCTQGTRSSRGHASSIKK